MYTFDISQIPKVTAKSNRNVFDTEQKTANEPKQTTHIHEERKKEKKAKEEKKKQRLEKYK